MIYPKYPETPAETVQYAAVLSTVHGKKYHPVRTPPGTVAYEEHGIRFAAVEESEVAAYLAGGCELIKPTPPAP